MSIDCIWCCSCGAETSCTSNDLSYGAVFQCPSCLTVWGRLRPKRGGDAWVRVNDDDVSFHRLLDPPEKEPEDDPAAATPTQVATPGTENKGIRDE